MASDRLGRHQDAHLVRGHHHAGDPTARTISAIRAVGVPASRRIMTVPTAISIKGAPPVPADERAEGSSSHSISDVNPDGAAAAGKISLPSFARRRHSEIRFARSPYLPATPQTVAPGSSVSATMRALRSSGHRRRPVAESSTPPDRKNSNVSSMEKLLPYSRTAKASQNSRFRKRWGPDTVY